MGGQSFHTKKQHQRVWELYLEWIAHYGDLAKEIKRSTYHEKISDQTGYSIISVRTIINKLVKNSTPDVYY